MNSMKFGKKRGQIAVFVIVGIVLIIIIGVFFLLRNNLSKEKGIDSQADSISSFVESCIEQTSNDAILHISKRGGYFIAPKGSIHNKIPYYYNKEKNLMPLKERIEDELSLYMDNMLFFCIKNFVDFPDFDVRHGEVESDVKIYDEKIVFEIKYPLSFSKGENSYVFEDFDFEVDVKLGMIYNVIEQIINEQKK